LGGYGSGPGGFSSKLTVEDCLNLKIEKLFQDRLIGLWKSSGSLVWRNTDTGEQTDSIGFRLDTDFENWITLTLEYTVTNREDKKTEIKEPIRITYTRPNYGGKRWWFHCPLIKNGRPCNRRVGRLYLPSGGNYFGCRHCYDLTYTSCQDSHKYDRLYALVAKNAGTTPDMVKRALSEEW
jgi:hypothetical protein